MLRGRSWDIVSLWTGLGIVLLVLVFALGGLSQQMGEARKFATANFDDSKQKLEFHRNFYCFPASDEKERVKRYTIGFGRKVLHAEAFISGFNLYDRFASLTTVNQVRVDANIASITGNQLVLELTFAFASSSDKPRFSTEGCIGWTVLAITAPE